MPIEVKNLPEKERSALNTYRQQADQLEALKQQRDELQRQLQTGTQPDVSTARGIQNQIKALDGEIAKAEAALYAAKNSKQLLQVAKKAKASPQRRNQTSVENAASYDIMGTEDSHSEIASLSIRFLSNRDILYNNLENVLPLDGYEDIACHADPYEFGFVDPDSGETAQPADAKLLAKLVRESGKYHGGPVRLIACEAGKLPNGIAQQFANEMGVPVLAPVKTVYTNSQGFMVLADSRLEALELLHNASEKWNPEGWIVFEPKEE